MMDHVQGKVRHAPRASPPSPDVWLGPWRRHNTLCWKPTHTPSAAAFSTTAPPSAVLAGHGPTTATPPPSSRSTPTNLLRSAGRESGSLSLHLDPNLGNPKNSTTRDDVGNIDFGNLRGNLNHVWRQSSAAGRCEVIPTNRSLLTPPGRNPNFVPLRGTERKWSTLGVTLDLSLR
jgi:hypothetical protein